MKTAQGGYFRKKKLTPDEVSMTPPRSTITTLHQRNPEVFIHKDKRQMEFLRLY